MREIGAKSRGGVPLLIGLLVLGACSTGPNGGDGEAGNALPDSEATANALEAMANDLENRAD